MDALTKLNEDFLSCNICTEIFKDPCTIGCQHTFCRRCLTTYTKTRRDAITAKSILCPNCNQMTRVPRPQEPVDQWCQQFKPSFLLQGLLDTFTSQERSGPIDHTCFTCQQVGKTTQAISVCENCDILFCEVCAKMHVATPMAADHVISPLGAGSKTLKSRRSEVEEITQHKSSLQSEIRRVSQQATDVDHTDSSLKLGHLKLIKDRSYHQDKPKFLSSVSFKSKDDTGAQDPCDIEVLDIGGTDTLVVTDSNNLSVKSFYTKNDTPHCTSLTFEHPCKLTKISQDRVAVSQLSHNSIELIKLTPDPVHVSSIKTNKKYICLTALSDTTLAAGCWSPPSIDVLDLSGRVLRSVITPSTGQQLIQKPRYMCTTRQGHIVVADGESDTVYCVTEQGEVLFTYELKGGGWSCGGVTTTDTGSVIVAVIYSNKIVQLTETGEYVRDLLTGQDGIVLPQGIRVHGNKLYITTANCQHVNIFHL